MVAERRDLRRQEILAAARRLLEQAGPDGLTMRRLAGALGIRAPSLYKHFRDKAELEVELISDGLAELGRDLGAADSPRGALLGLAQAYRAFALRHPNLYRLMTERELPRDLLRPGTEAEAAEPLLKVVSDRDRARAAWAFAHGMVHLELAGRFPPDADLDRAWEVGVRALAGAQRTG